MSNSTFHELSRRKIVITKYEDPIVSWHLSFLAILTEKGLHIFNFSHNFQCPDSKIDFQEKLIMPPKYGPTAGLFSDRIINNNMHNIELTEMIVDHTLWPHNTQLTQEMASIITFQWSPVGILYKNDSAIAILTNVGTVEVYLNNIKEWKCVLHLSTLLSDDYIKGVSKPRSFDQLKEMASLLASTAICWSPTLNDDGSCYFLTAQRNGNLVVWLIQTEEEQVTAQLVSCFNSECGEIYSILWIENTKENFQLVCSNVLGQVYILNIEVDNNVLKLIKSHNIWPDKDKMIAKHIQYIKAYENVIITFNKHRHLVCLMIDKKCNILHQFVKNINDYRIMGIIKARNEIYISVVNRLIYKLDISYNSENFEVALNMLHFNKELSPTYELYGIDFSWNKVLTAMLVIDRKINCKKKPLYLELILMSTKEKLDSIFDILVDNPTEKLTHYWDVVELFRITILKKKQLPQIDYNRLHTEACSNLYKLKVYFIICSLFDILKKQFKIKEDVWLPEESVEVVKEEILVAHAEKQLHSLHELKEAGELSDFQMECFLGAKTFLEYYFQKNNKDLFDAVGAGLLNVVDQRLYTCQCCDEVLTGMNCANGHPNMFCALTFTPIIGDKYLVCMWCNLTARMELLSEAAYCLYCDQNLKICPD